MSQVSQAELCIEFRYHRIDGMVAAIDDNNLIRFLGLRSQASQRFPQVVRPVFGRNDYS
jgi:hypothetical protein